MKNLNLFGIQKNFKRYKARRAIFFLLLMFSTTLFMPIISATDVSSWADLAGMSSGLSGDYTLINNLSSSDTGYSTYASCAANGGAGWIPIGNNSIPFTGTFNGGGYTISDWCIIRNDTSYQGLFGYVNGSTIQNFTIKNTLIMGSQYVGTLAGSAGDGNDLDNNIQNIGIINTTVNCSVVNFCGGFVGVSRGYINNSYVQGSVRGNYRIGGFVGATYAGTNCIANSYSTASVSAGGTYIGGFVGQAYGGSTLTGCFWDTQTSGQASSAGCTGKTTSQMKDILTFTTANWDISLNGAWTNERWSINNGTNYAILRYGTSAASKITSLTLEYPKNETIFFSSEGSNFVAFMNITGSNPGSYEWDNITYYLYREGAVFNISTVSGLSGTEINNSFFINSSTIGDYLWDVYACYGNATFKNCTWSDDNNFTLQNIPFQIASYNFNQNVYETSRQQFNIRIHTLPTVTSVSSTFTYNGTTYSSTTTDLGSGNYNITNNLDIPLAKTDGNKTFYWNYMFTFTGGTTLNQSGTIYSHNVSQIHLSLCNSTYTVPFVNFSTFSATNPFPVVNATFKSAWNFWLGNGNVKKNMSFEDVSEGNNTFNFCMSPTDKTYNVDAHIEIDATGYSLNSYYLDEATLTNTTNIINLYLLNDSASTLTVLKVINPSQQPQEDVTIQIQLYDVGTDTFYTIAMAKTSYNGEDLVYLNWYNSLYKFIFIQNGEVVKTINPFKISETPQIFTIEGDTTFIYQKFIDMAYSLTYNNVTENFVLTFTKPSSTVDTGCLRVIKRGATSDTEICNVCETSSSATLYCNIGSSGNGTYVATFYATGSFWSFGSITQTIGGNFASSIYDLLGNDDATFYALIFSGVVVFLMFINLPLGILGMLLGIVGGAALGFQVLSWGTYISIVIVGGVIIWFVKK